MPTTQGTGWQVNEADSVLSMILIGGIAATIWSHKPLDRSLASLLPPHKGGTSTTPLHSAGHSKSPLSFSLRREAFLRHPAP